MAAASTERDIPGRLVTAQVEVTKVVNKTCSDDSIYSTVEAYDDIGCFDGCGRKRNTSSACWVGCFYRTVLGADGMLPSGFANPGGIPYVRPSGIIRRARGVRALQEDESRRRRERGRGYSVETGRGDAAAATRIVL